MNEATKKRAVARIQAALGQAGEVVLRAFDVLARYAGLGRRMHDAG